MIHYEIKGHQLIIRQKDDSGNIMQDYCDFLYPIEETINVGDCLYVRLNVPLDKIYNENIFHVWMPRNTCWQIPRRNHPKTYSPYIRIEKHHNKILAYNDDGTVMELIGREILQEYHISHGPKYIIDSCNITFPNGVMKKLDHEIVEIVETGTVVIVRIESPLTVSYPQNVFAFDKNGGYLWQVPYRKAMRDRRYVTCRMEGDLLHLGNTGGLEMYLDPLTGKIVKEEMLQY